MPYEIPEQVPESDVPARAGKIMAACRQLLRSRYGGELPTRYMTFDLETSGLNPENDLILEWGHCLVEDCKVANTLSFYVNWYESKVVPAAWLDEQLAKLSRIMELNGRSWRLTPGLIKEKGIPPAKAMEYIHTALSLAQSRGLLLVSHNGWNFDTGMIVSALSQDLGVDFVFADDQLLDTGAIVKAAQIADEKFAHPRPGETLKSYAKRIIAKRVTAKWNLDRFCSRVFDLHAQGIDADAMHTAGEDTRALVYLVEAFRRHAANVKPAVSSAVMDLAEAADARARGSTVSKQRNR